MKNSKKIIKQNTAVINDFIDMYGKDTLKEMSAFLFDIQGAYLGLRDTDWTNKGKEDIRCKFGMIHGLVTGLQKVKD